MITEETATQIARRNKLLAKINGCIENAERMKYAELTVEYSNTEEERMTETFPLSCAGVLRWLHEMKAYEDARLEELNTLAVQEAQDG
jgi:hypothetical protein